jgi:hypothetical protein
MGVVAVLVVVVLGEEQGVVLLPLALAALEEVALAGEAQVEHLLGVVPAKRRLRPLGGHRAAVMEALAAMVLAAMVPAVMVPAEERMAVVQMEEKMVVAETGAVAEAMTALVEAAVAPAAAAAAAALKAGEPVAHLLRHQVAVPAVIARRLEASVAQPRHQVRAAAAMVAVMVVTVVILTVAAMGHLMAGTVAAREVAVAAAPVVMVHRPEVHQPRPRRRATAPAKSVAAAAATVVVVVVMVQPGPSQQARQPAPAIPWRPSPN